MTKKLSSDDDIPEPEHIADKKTIVFKESTNQLDVKDLIEKKKTSFFGSTFRRPKPTEIIVKLPTLFYEHVVYVSGKCTIDFFRKAEYKIKVASDVSEVILGDTTFPIMTESGMWKKFGKKMKEGVGDDTQDLLLEADEHATRTITDSMYFDNHGRETKFQYTIDSKTIENYPKKILEIHKDHLRKNELTENAIIEKLGQKIKNQLNFDFKLNSSKFSIDEWIDIHIPVYEAKAYDSKKRVAIIQVDAITSKIRL